MSTSELYAYGDIIRDVIGSNDNIVSQANEALKSGFGVKEDFEPIVNEANLVIKESSKVMEDIQKEIDLRMKNNFKLHKGLGASQKIIEKFHKKVQEIAKRNAEKAEKNSYLKKVDA